MKEITDFKLRGKPLKDDDFEYNMFFDWNVKYQ